MRLGSCRRWSHSSAWRRPPTQLGETTWSEILDLCARILRETTDARFDAKRGTSDQPSSSGRNAPAGILICASLPGGLVCHGGRADPPVQHLAGGGRVHQRRYLDESNRRLAAKAARRARVGLWRFE